MTETELRDDFPFTANRKNAKRRSSLGMTAGAAAALVTLVGCGDDGGGGAAAPDDNGTFTGGTGGDTHDLASRGEALMTVDAGAGDDTVTTGSGAQAITGGAGDDTIAGGAGDDTIHGNTAMVLGDATETDTAVYLGSLGDYTIAVDLHEFMSATPEMGVPRITVRDEDADMPASTPDEGEDTLVGIEVLTFQNGTADANDDVYLMVIRGDTTGRTLTDDVHELFIGAATADGTSSAAADGGAGDDIMFGLGGDDFLSGGDGDDGDDVAVFEGFVEGYDISAALSSGTVTLIVTDTATTGTGAVDEGSDTLTGFETLQFANATGADGSDDVYLVVFSLAGNPTRTAADNEILLGTEMVEGETTSVDGGDGSDFMFGFGGANMLNGGMGNDIIDGGADGDTLNGDAGDDIMFGLGGDDVAVFEGFVEGNDISAALSSGTVTLTVTDTATTGTYDVDEGSDTLTGFETLQFANATGADGSDDVNLVVFSLDGNPTRTDADSEILLGTDMVEGTTNAVDGGDGNDFMFGFGGADMLDGGMGNDIIDGGADGDTLKGDAGDDIMFGLGGDDVLDGGAGDDVAVFEGFVEGFDKSAALSSGTVTLIVTDTATTGTGDVDEGSDTLTGFETLQFANATGADGSDDVYLVVVSLMGTPTRTDADSEILLGTDMVEGATNVVDGGDGNDFMFGFGGAEMLDGGMGNDIMDGGADGDTLNGDAGDDIMFGLGGDDVLDGGAGDDVAVFEGAVAGYDISAALASGIVTLAVMDTAMTGGMAVDEGTDTLFNIEMLRFDDVTLAVVGDHSDSGRTATDDELIVGGDTADGMASANMRVMGGAGGDYILGLGGDDHIEGGAGDDLIFGGTGTGDVAYFSSARTDYIVWTTGTGDERIVHVRDRDDGDGYDQLNGVEIFMFGTDAAVDVAGLSAGTAPPDAPALVNDDADTAVPYVVGMTVDATDWFTVPSGSTAEYSLTGHAGFMINSGTGAITVPGTLAATASVTVTVSTVTGAANTFDDVSHTVMITVPSASGSVDFPNGGDETSAGDGASAPAADDCDYTCPAQEDYEAVSQMTVDGDYFGL